MTAFDVLVPRVAAEATRRPYTRSVLPTSHDRGFASGLMALWATLPSPWSSDRPGTAVFGSAWSVLIPRSDMRAMRAMCAFVSIYTMPHFKKRCFPVHLRLDHASDAALWDLKRMLWPKT